MAIQKQHQKKKKKKEQTDANVKGCDNDSFTHLIYDPILCLRVTHHPMNGMCCFLPVTCLPLFHLPISYPFLYLSHFHHISYFFTSIYLQSRKNTPSKNYPEKLGYRLVATGLQNLESLSLSFYLEISLLHLFPGSSSFSDFLFDPHHPHNLFDASKLLIDSTMKQAVIQV